jgi:hypothetical protein
MITLTLIVATMVILATLAARGVLSHGLRVALWAAVALFIFFVLAPIIVRNVQHPPLWDFLCFWLYAHVAARLHDVYQPANFWILGHTLSSDHDFASEVLNVGMPYPPPTILLFYPLALFRDPQWAAAGWYGLNVAALFALVVVLWRTAFQGEGRAAPLAVFALVAAFPPTVENFGSAETLIIATLFCALFFADQRSARSGVWLALAAIVKPLAIVLVLAPLVKRDLRLVATTATTLVAATVVATSIIGTHAVLSYILHNPALREPAYLYAESTNQSLWSLALKYTHATSPARVVYIFGSMVLFFFSTKICLSSNDGARGLSAAMLVPLALMTYPASSGLYGLLLIVPLSILWRNRSQFAGGSYAVIALWVGETILLSVGAAWKLGFAGFFFCWLMLAIYAPKRAVSTVVPAVDVP